VKSYFGVFRVLTLSLTAQIVNGVTRIIGEVMEKSENKGELSRFELMFSEDSLLVGSLSR
jgi:hypothetical protein